MGDSLVDRMRVQDWPLQTSTSDSVGAHGTTRANQRDHNQRRLGLNRINPSPARPGGSDSGFHQERSKPLARSQLSNSDRRPCTKSSPQDVATESSDPLGGRLAAIQAHTIYADEFDCHGFIGKPNKSSTRTTSLSIGFVSWYCQPSTREDL